MASYDGEVRSRDTAPEAYDVQIEVYRRMTPTQRFEIAVQLSEQVNEMAADGIRSRHPEYSEDEVRWALHRLRLGDDLFLQVWPDAPFLAP